MTNDQLTIKVVRCVNYKNDSSWNYKVNLYPYNTLYFVMDGDGYIGVNGQTIPLEKGYVYLIPANTVYSCWCDSYIHKLYIEVSVEVVPGYDIFSSIYSVRNRQYDVEDTSKLVKVNEIFSPKNMLYLKGEVTKVLSEFVDQAYSLPDTGILEFRNILNDIEENLSGRLRISDIALKHGWNCSVLSRKFKKAFNCTLKRYVETLLINKIKQDLIITNKTIKEIAADYQFSDQYYLSSFFKKHVNVSPSHYRLEHNSRQP